MAFFLVSAGKQSCISGSKGEHCASVYTCVSRHWRLYMRFWLYDISEQRRKADAGKETEPIQR